MEKIVFSYAGKDRMSKVAQLHSHRGYELLYIDSGHCVITFNNSQKLDGAQGDVFLIPPHIQHERYNLSECHTYYAVFECNSVEFMNMKTNEKSYKEILGFYYTGVGLSYGVN